MDSGLQSGGEGRSLCHWPAMDCCLFWRYVWVSPTATDRSMLGQILVFAIGVTQGSGTSRCGHGRSRCLSLAKFLFISFDNHHASHQHDMMVHLSGGHLPEASFVVVSGTPRFKELSILTSRIWCHSEKSPFPFLEARARLFVCLGATGTLNKDAHFCRRWLWAVLADIRPGFGSRSYLHKVDDLLRPALSPEWRCPHITLILDSKAGPRAALPSEQSL